MALLLGAREPHKRGRFGWGLEGGRASQGLLVTLVLIHGDDSSTLAPQPTQDICCIPRSGCRL